MHKAIFLRRDGLMNQRAPANTYITSWEDFAFLPGVPEAIRSLNQAGYLVLLVTNQPGIIREHMTGMDVEKIHENMCRALRQQGAHVDGIFVCPYGVGECCCREPEISLFKMAEHEFTIDKKASWMVGDRESDVVAGKLYGIRTIRTGDLYRAVEQILRTEQTQVASEAYSERKTIAQL